MDEQQELHEVIIHIGRTHRLDDEDVCSSHIFVNVNINLAIRKAERERVMRLVRLCNALFDFRLLRY